MVVASSEAEALIAEHNGLTIIDMLRPYGYFHHLSGTDSQDYTIYVVAKEPRLLPHSDQI